MTGAQEDRRRSFVGPAFLALLGYFCFFVVGFVLNIYYLRRARAEDGTGQGCLIALLIVFPTVVVLVAAMIVLSIVGLNA